MITKFSLADLLAQKMQENLNPINKEIGRAEECLKLASEIFINAGLQKQANEILKISKKIKTDKHTSGLTSEKQIKNLLDHGTQFNLADDPDDDLANLDINDADLEVIESELMDDMGFEDEI